MSYKSGNNAYPLYNCTMTKLGTIDTLNSNVSNICYVISMFPNCHAFYNNIAEFSGSLYIAIENDKITIYTGNKADLKLYSYIK